MSSIDDLKGVTKKAKTSLKESGYDIQKLATASVEELVELPGIGEKTAQKIISLAKEMAESATAPTVEEPEVKEPAKQEPKKVEKKEEKTKAKPKPKAKPKKKPAKLRKVAEKPKVTLLPSQEIGRIISLRDSSSGIRKPNQVVVAIDPDLKVEPSTLVGRIVEAEYPSGKKVKGKVMSIHGRKTSGKFVVRFRRNISYELTNRPVRLS